MELKPRLQITFLLIAGVFLAANASAAEVYRWVDENGEVHYSESLPPNFQDQGHDVLNERGIVLDEDQSLTPTPPEEVPDEEQLQELPRDSSGMQRPKALYSEAELQRRMDNFLMLRYGSEQEITDAMNVEIKQLDYDRRLLTTTRESMEEAYRGQIRQAANRQRAGQQVDEKTAIEINRLQARLAENSRSLDYMEIREVDIRAEFGKQLERYRFSKRNGPRNPRAAEKAICLHAAQLATPSIRSTQACWPGVAANTAAENAKSCAMHWMPCSMSGPLQETGRRQQVSCPFWGCPSTSTRPARPG